MLVDVVQQNDEYGFPLSVYSDAAAISRNLPIPTQFEM